MGARHGRRHLLVSVVACTAWSCHLTGGADSGALPEAGGDGGAEGSTDGSGADGGDADSPDGGATPGSGPLTLLAREVVLTTERRCDFDEDGIGDNSIADLGPPHAALLAVTLNALIDRALYDGERFAFHFPSVDELAGPTAQDARALMFGGVDADRLLEREDFDDRSHFDDDFSGEEPFYADGDSLDECGEPRYRSTNASIDEGALPIVQLDLSLPVGDARIVLTGSEVTGQIEPFGRTFELGYCGYVLVSDAGGEPGVVAPELTLLEELLFGGAALGVSTLPGLAPDVDVDGDGLERLIQDADGRLEACIDGDDTSIPGRDCWRDPRIADGISLDIEIAGTSARYAGREPGWQHRVEGGCPEGLPEESFFDGPEPYTGECVAAGQLCDPLLEDRACCDEELLCFGGYRAPYRCTRRCEASPCAYGLWTGRCVLQPGHSSDLEVCWPLTRPPQAIPCDLGSESCTLPARIGGEGLCAEDHDGVATCFPSCTMVPDDCEHPLFCMPLVFEDGGACAELR